MPAKQSNYVLALLRSVFNFLISRYRSPERFSLFFFIFFSPTHPVPRQLKSHKPIFTTRRIPTNFLVKSSRSTCVTLGRRSPPIDRFVNQSGIVFPRTGEFSCLIGSIRSRKIYPLSAGYRAAHHALSRSAITDRDNISQQTI